MKKPTVALIPCPGCAGRGKIPGHATGMALKLEREERGVNRPQLLRFFAKPEGGNYSESYTIDLERDQRAWTQDLIDRYRKAIERAVRLRLQTEKKEVVGANP